MNEKGRVIFFIILFVSFSLVLFCCTQIRTNISCPPQVTKGLPFQANKQGGWFGKPSTISVTSPPRSPSIKDEWTNSLGITFVWIPKGEFMMGNLDSNNNDRKEELPAHPVKLTRGFWISKYEIKQSEWLKVFDRLPNLPSNIIADNGNIPVHGVTYLDCCKFISKLNIQEATTCYSLPSEAQWEYACRANTRTPFYTGQIITPKQANFDHGQYRPKVVPVGSYPPNSFGLHDMHGNLAEWCSDWFTPSYYSSSPKTDPVGSAKGNSRVIRGGHYYIDSEACRSSARSSHPSSMRNRIFGIRLVYNPLIKNE